MVTRFRPGCSHFDPEKLKRFQIWEYCVYMIALFSRAKSEIQNKIPLVGGLSPISHLISLTRQIFSLTRQHREYQRPLHHFVPQSG